MVDIDDAGEKRKLAEFRTRLKRRIMEAEADLESLRILLEFIDKTLLEKGFKKAEILRQKPKKTRTRAVSPQIDASMMTPLKTSAGEILANLAISESTMRVIVADDKTLNTQTPPFKQFLIERVLEKMKEKDSEAVSRGEIPPGKTFSYELILEDDNIREIKVRNCTLERVRELKSSIRWTLEKMYEKTETNTSNPT